MRKTAIGNAKVQISNDASAAEHWVLTVTENELCNTSKVHSNAAKEIVVSAQAN
jgi:hypothetical protein